LNERVRRAAEFASINVNKVGKVNIAVCRVCCAEKRNSVLGAVYILPDELAGLDDPAGKRGQRLGFVPARELLPAWEVFVGCVELGIDPASDFAPPRCESAVSVGGA
jgi:hypothetical protein